jgi:tetratricopeptide (TPR) repeat protein
MFKKIFSVLLVVTLISCAGDEGDVEIDPNLTLSQQIDRMIEQDRYEAALELLDEHDSSDDEIQMLLEKTHLNYGYYSMNTFDETEMRTRMNRALIQFAEVLKINPNNAAAREQIEQIMAIYDTIPDRHPEPEVLDKLREVGYDF